MNHLNLFLELTRLRKPIGYMLLFWPCSWGLTIAYDFSSNLNIYFFFLSLFFLGSVLMRSAGCIINDILDRKFDKKVLDLKERRFYIRMIVTILILYMVGTLFYKSISPFHNCIRDEKANVIECTGNSTW